MFSIKNFFVIAAVLGTLALFAAGIRPVLAEQAPAPITLDVNLAPDVTLEQVAIGSDRSVNVDGFTADPDGGCLPVAVFIDGEREPWWPVYRCMAVSESGSWSLHIPSDDGGQPMGIHLQVGR